MTTIRNPDHVTIAVENAASAIEFFELLGFRKQHLAMVDGGPPARYMGMPDMKLGTSRLHWKEWSLASKSSCSSSIQSRRTIRVRTRRICGDGATTSCILRRRCRAVTRHLVANRVNMLSDEMDYISRRLFRRS